MKQNYYTSEISCYSVRRMGLCHYSQSQKTEYNQKIVHDYIIVIAMLVLIQMTVTDKLKDLYNKAVIKQRVTHWQTDWDKTRCSTDRFTFRQFFFHVETNRRRIVTASSTVSSSENYTYKGQAALAMTLKKFSHFT